MRESDQGGRPCCSTWDFYQHEILSYSFGGFPWKQQVAFPSKNILVLFIPDKIVDFQMPPTDSTVLYCTGLSCAASGKCELWRTVMYSLPVCVPTERSNLRGYEPRGLIFNKISPVRPGLYCTYCRRYWKKRCLCDRFQHFTTYILLICQGKVDNFWMEKLPNTQQVNTWQFAVSITYCMVKSFCFCNSAQYTPGAGKLEQLSTAPCRFFLQ